MARPSRRPVALLSVWLLATSGLAWAEANDDQADERFHLVERVIDGDTLVLKGGERVRLIGVDTPETVHPQKPVEYFGKEASKFTRGMAEGKRVRLEYEQGAPQKDRYGRTLAYVYLANGTKRSSFSCARRIVGIRGRFDSRLRTLRDSRSCRQPRASHPWRRRAEPTDPVGDGGPPAPARSRRRRPLLTLPRQEPDQAVGQTRDKNLRVGLP